MRCAEEATEACEAMGLECTHRCTHRCIVCNMVCAEQTNKHLGVVFLPWLNQMQIYREKPSSWKSMFTRSIHFLLASLTSSAKAPVPQTLTAMGPTALSIS